MPSIGQKCKKTWWKAYWRPRHRWEDNSKVYRKY